MKNKKNLGQNWLKDRAVLTEIAECAKTENNELALEVGPGLGTLTSVLLKNFEKVVAVEFDDNLAKNLPNSFPGKNLEVINENILDFDLNSLPKGYTAVGNIPYYITSPIIRKFLSSDNKPRRIVFLVQKEVAERLAAGKGKHTILSLSAQIYANVSLGPVVPRDFFTPPPKVDSQVVVLDPYAAPLASEEVLSLAKLGFTHPRKKLAANLSVTLKRPRAQILKVLMRFGIGISARPADLSIEDWINLHKALIIKK